MNRPYVARLRAPGRSTRWYVLADRAERPLRPDAVQLLGWGPYPTQRAAEAAYARLLAGDQAVVA